MGNGEKRMVKKLLVTSMLAIVFVIGGCGAVDDSTVTVSQQEASVSKAYTIVSETTMKDRDIILLGLQHKDTGCHYNMTVNIYQYKGTDTTQMFIEKDGVSVPYCN